MELNSTINQKLREIEANYLSIVRVKEKVSLGETIHNFYEPKSVCFFEFALTHKIASLKQIKSLVHIEDMNLQY